MYCLNSLSRELVHEISASKRLVRESNKRDDLINFDKDDLKLIYGLNKMYLTLSSMLQFIYFLHCTRLELSRKKSVCSSQSIISEYCLFEPIGINRFWDFHYDPAFCFGI